MDFYHGANNYLFIRGNTYAFDSNILSAVLSNHFVDVKNVAYDYDVTKEFTWDFKELVEIKKRNRVVKKIYKPTFSFLGKFNSASKFQRNKEKGIVISKREPLKDFEVYKFIEDKYASEEEKKN